jgi:hypothetical protein
MREQFIEKRFGKSSLEIIEHANSIIAEYPGAASNAVVEQLCHDGCLGEGECGSW